MYIPKRSDCLPEERLCLLVPSKQAATRNIGGGKARHGHAKQSGKPSQLPEQQTSLE